MPKGESKKLNENKHKNAAQNAPKNNAHNHSAHANNHHDHAHAHHHHDHTQSGIFKLTIAFLINILLSVVEFIAGLLSGSVALIGDALHNTMDSLSILVAIIAAKIGLKGRSEKFSYGYKRAESIGGFINLILLFIAGAYLLYEGVLRLINPEPLDGLLIVIVSIIALIIDIATAKISHAHSHNNMNMRMLFLHNLSDALGSIGVLISGFLAMQFEIFFVDGLVAILIAIYMIFHAFASFHPISNMLMNATPNGLDLDKIIQKISQINGVSDLHHIHIWNIDEENIALDCHIVSKDMQILGQIQRLLKDEFGITHSNIQIEVSRNEFCDCD